MRIKEVIKEKGFTVKEVAERLGMSSPSLSDAINGNPTVDKLQRIADALNCPVIDLFERPSTGQINCPNCGISIKFSAGLEGQE